MCGPARATTMKAGTSPSKERVMKWSPIAVSLTLIGCGAEPSPPRASSQASDVVNLCASHTLPAGTPFSVPDADAPFQARDPDNDLDEWFWTTHLYGLITGRQYSSESFLFRFRAFGQDVRWGQVSITDPSTGKYHQGQYLTPGLFSETVNRFDLDMGISGAPRATGGGGGPPDNPPDHVTASTAIISWSPRRTSMCGRPRGLPTRKPPRCRSRWGSSRGTRAGRKSRARTTAAR
jgi:hypothetical protein